MGSLPAKIKNANKHWTFADENEKMPGIIGLSIENKKNAGKNGTFIGEKISPGKLYIFLISGSLILMLNIWDLHHV